MLDVRGLPGREEVKGSVKVCEALPAIDRLGGDTLGATEADRWGSNVYDRPDTGEITRKRTWVIRQDGKFFGAGW